MNQKFIFLPMKDQYPFGSFEKINEHNLCVLVRKRIESLAEIEATQEKVKILKQLNFSSLVRLQRCLEEDSILNLMFEYVPIKLENWIWNINESFIEHIKDDLHLLSHYLASQNIQIIFNLANLGMNDQYKIKYFVGLDFSVLDSQHNKCSMIQAYKTQIDQIFTKQIENCQSSKNILEKSLRDENQLKNTMSSSKANSENFASCEQCVFFQDNFYLNKQILVNEELDDGLMIKSQQILKNGIGTPEPERMNILNLEKQFMKCFDSDNEENDYENTPKVLWASGNSTHSLMKSQDIKARSKVAQRQSIQQKNYTRKSVNEKEKEKSYVKKESSKQKRFKMAINNSMKAIQILKRKDK